MKKYFIALILILFVASGVAIAQQYDIPAETRPAVNKHKIVDVIIHANSKQAIVTVAKGYVDGSNFISVSEIKVIFMDVTDNPDTPQDETLTEYTDFLTAIDINRTGLKNAVKTKLGIQ